MRVMATLAQFEGFVEEWKIKPDCVTFRLCRCPLEFYLFEEDCIYEGYTKCRQWITQDLAMHILTIDAFVNMENPRGAVVERLNLYSFLSLVMRSDR